jgi:DNA polymerase-1
MKAGMIEVAGRLRGRDDAHMLLQVHDELLLEVRESAVPEVAATVCDAMAADIGLEVPLVVEAKSGANWGETAPVGEA